MSMLFVALTAMTTVGAPIPSSEVKQQNDSFEQLWDARFVWKLDDLPKKGGVDKFRVPYSGYIYPDRGGGTRNVLRKYDLAFNGGRSLATSHEAWDTKAFKEPAKGIFGGRALFGRMEVPDWYGHCNGWTAAAIRHAEPQRGVIVRGVRFTPSDIKGLLAEIYIYNDHNVLAGDNNAPLNAGVFHAIMTNWLGRGEHPLGMESDPTKEKWNYPVYAYATSSAKHSDRRVEVKMNIAYALDSDGEYDESPRYKQVKYFHYMLDLNASGNIVGGYFLRDSSLIDMLWVPLRPKMSGATGNEAGNPYINVDQVLAIWRASVAQETRDKWVAVDSAEKDKVALLLDGEELTTVSSNIAPVVTDVAVESESPAKTEVSDVNKSALEGKPTSESDVDEETDEGKEVARELTDDDPAPAPLEDSEEEAEDAEESSQENSDSESEAEPFEIDDFFDDIFESAD